MMKKRIFTILFGIFCFSIGFSQVDFIVNSIPSNTPAEDDIYIAGDFNGWNPGDPNYILQTNNDGYPSIELTGSGTIQFKFTRGSWATVEGNEDGQFLPNRTYTFGSDTEAFFQILSWEDTGSTDTNHTTTDNVSVMDEDFYIPQLDRTRRVWIYLPPDYEQSTNSYAVLYMHDGQNLFDDLTSFIGEWGVDEMLNEAYADGKEVPIVVGIDNGGGHRLDEYSPWINPTYGGGEGDEYIDFIVETLKPHIDANYRTLTDRDNTGIMGSSMGGFISFYAGLQHPEVFSKLGVFSPSFWFSDSVYTFAQNFVKEYDFKIYMLVGMLEGSQMVSGQASMHNLLINNGFNQNEVTNIVSADGEHSEWFWKREFTDAYNWMFRDYAVGVEAEDILSTLDVYPNPASEFIYVESINNINDEMKIELLNANGKLILIDFMNKHKFIDLKNIESGIYIMRIISSTNISTRKIVIPK